MAVNFIDISFIILYIIVVLILGYVSKRAINTDKDFFLASRKLPVWITSIGFISANFGAIELIANTSNAAQYGLSTIHFYLIGAVPGMLLLGLLLMPFYYTNRVGTVQEYFRLRFDKKSHLVSSIFFVVSQILIGGVNIYALGILFNKLLNINIFITMICACIIIAFYIIAGGIVSTVYAEIIQFFIISVGFIGLSYAAFHHIDGINGLQTHLKKEFLFTWQGVSIGNWSNPLGDWIGIIIGECFIGGFAYWTTNFSEVQRCLLSKNLNSSRLTPIVAAFPKMLLFPALMITLGLSSIIIFPKEILQNHQYNEAIPLLIKTLLPHGILGLVLTGLVAAFMAGISANISSSNAVLVNDIIKPYIKKNRTSREYLLFGRIATGLIIVASFVAGLIASRYNNISNYLQMLFSFTYPPMFIALILGIFVKRISNIAACFGLIFGPVIGITTHYVINFIPYFYPHRNMHLPIAAQMQNFYTILITGVSTLIVIIGISLFTKANSAETLQKGLLWRDRIKENVNISFYKKPLFVASIVGIVGIIMTITMMRIV